MKLKVLYFLLPLVAGASILTFCAKEPQIPTDENTGTGQTATNQGATDRAKCVVTVTVTSGSVTVCGTNMTLVQCSTNFLGNPLFGTAVLTAGNAGVYGVLSPGSIKLTGNNGPAVPFATVAAGGNVVNVPLTAGQTKEISFDAITCVPTVI